MQDINRKKRQLQLILVIAAALGSSSASLSGAMSSLTAQHQPPTYPIVA